jgi:hypothetical protein
VRFERPGYSISETTVTTATKSTTRLRCLLAPYPGLSPRDTAELVVLSNEPKATIRVDGELYRKGKVPLGAHLVEVAAPGFETWSDIVTVRPGLQKRVDVALEPTPERRRADRVHTRKVVAYSMGAGGIVLGGIAAILYGTNQNRYDDWADDRQALADEIANGEGSIEHAREAADLQERAASIQRTDDIALGSAIIGGVLLTVSVGLLLTGEDPSTERSARAPLRFTF